MKGVRQLLQGNGAVALQEIVQAGDVLLTLGAGDVTLVGPLLVDQLKKRVSRG